MKKQLSEQQRLFLSAAALFLGQAMYMYYVGARAVSLLSILEGFGAEDYYSLTIVLGSMSMSIMLPLGGKLGDMFGRKLLFAIGMVGFLISELILGAAQAYWQIALGIVLCGAAYGLSWVQNAALIVDIYPAKTQPKILGGVFVATSVGSLLGPIVGGWCVEYLSWRAIFFFMLPLTALGTLCTFVGMPKGQIAGRKAKIDWAGTAFLTVATMALLYLLSMGGKQFPWLSLKALALLLVSAVSLVFLIRAEQKAVAPIVPLHLFRNKLFQLGLAIALVSAVSTCCINYLPSLYQQVMGMSPTLSGVAVAPRQIGTILASLALGQYLGRTGNYKGPSLFNAAVFILSMGLMLLFGASTPFLLVCVAEFIYGIANSTGNMLPRSLGQTGFKAKDLGMGLAFITFVGTIGSSVGTALVGCALNIAQMAGVARPLQVGLKVILGLVFLSGFGLIPLALKFDWTSLSRNKR